MFEQFVQSIVDPLQQMKAYLPDVLLAFAIIWLINIVNWIFLRSRLNVLGIYPRNIFGLIGIPLSPIFHGNFNHLFFNSIPAIPLVLFVLLGGLPAFVMVTAIIVIGGGFLVWLFGRRAIHLGMSGVISGYFSFLLLNAYRHVTVMSLLLAVVVLYYFGSIFLGLFPRDKGVSWEAHVFGFAMGIVASFYYLPLLISCYPSFRS